MENFEIEHLRQIAPDTLQQEAVISRARQLTDFKWSPIRDIPTYSRREGHTVLYAGAELVGFPYSSTELTDKFITENVSIETFLSAIPNPYSKLYQAGHGAFNTCNYGIVCNGLARYAFGINRRVSTVRWSSIPGMRCVALKNEYNVNDIKLCDILYAVNEKNLYNHVSLITGLFQDDHGDIVAIEVSEAVRPLCKRVVYNIEEYWERFQFFALWRYDFLDQVPLLDQSVEDLLIHNPYKNLPNLSVDNGNKSNYLEGEETIISVCVEGNDVLQVIDDDEMIEEIAVSGKAVIPRRFSRGYYVLKLKNSGDVVEFCVNQANISFSTNDKSIIIKADSCDSNSEILYMDFRVAGKGCAALSKYEDITDEEKTTGIIERVIPGDAENFKVYFKNPYGVWTHRMQCLKN